jgi:multiple sugar transport system permease protein
LIGLGMIYPILWMFSASLKETSEIWTDVSALIPRSVHLENYSNGWEGFGDYSFSVFYKNSFIYAGFGTLFQVTASALVAYGFSRVEFTGRRFWFSLMLTSMMLPDQIRLIPQYIMFSEWTGSTASNHCSLVWGALRFLSL